ncbi:MAG: cobalt ECF transporter T component CbiQ [Candidatus Omnitrophica bacterium]|nr:cobalt ECF transporter T component CbiQ [Candidatus Omnitrophota bacterium]MDD5355289.1 cobalt ECF transporter T component CbiQ [Candidatus Omnitrophota bacterium]
MHHFYIDEYSELKSPLHRFDPRVKIITFFSFILFVIFTSPHSYFTFLLYGCVLCALIGLSRIPWRFVLVHSLVIIPFVLMVAVFIPFLKKGQIAGAYSFGSINLTITYDGIAVFWNILVKSYLSIVCVILMMASTKFTHFLRALENMRIPNIFTMILSFMYRYVFVIADELMEMRQAKEARSIGGTKWFHTKVLANMLGVLFIRAYEKGESVYLAMCARGFQGAIKTIDRLKISGFDIMFSCIIFAVLISIKIFAG